jgi:lipoprotein-anchoring transpeptidase ErfK/SrfK
MFVKLLSIALLATTTLFAQQWQPAEGTPQSAYRYQSIHPQTYAQPQKRNPTMGGGLLEAMFGDTKPAPMPQARQYASRQPEQRPAAPYQENLSFDDKYTPQNVSYDGGHAAGTVVIDTRTKFLYFVLGNSEARRYGVGVGRPGFAWKGVKSVTRKAEWPDWTPPPEMLKRRPDLPRFMKGGGDNPMGARAMYLGSSMFRIHGTNEPHTIGHAVSSGCFRMRNDDVTDLYSRVRVGTKVIVI